MVILSVGVGVGINIASNLNLANDFPSSTATRTSMWTVNCMSPAIRMGTKRSVRIINISNRVVFVVFLLLAVTFLFYRYWFDY